MELVFDKEAYYKRIAELYEQAESELNEFKELEEGWDSYDAKAININAIEIAKIVVNYIIEYLVEFDFAIFPTSDGGVSIQIEFEDGEIDREPSYFDCMIAPKEDISRLLSIDIYEDKITLFFRDDIKDESKLKKITKIKDLPEIKNYLDEVFKVND